MGCLVSILFFIFFPVIYFWYQINRAKSNFRDFHEQQMRQRSGSTSYSSQNTTSEETEAATADTPQGKRPHVFKPGEGEYVEFSEVDD